MSFNEKRYDSMEYRRCGQSGLKLPAISLGMWHNFGTHADHENCRTMMRTAFDLGVTHFDLANNYGPLPGSAEERVGRILKEDFSAHRDELILSTKAGYGMWSGPYGDWGSKKYLVSSLDQSLKRLGVDYVDVFYHHRPDPDTPLEETLGALDLIVRQGKALYAAVSNYSGDHFVQAMELIKKRGWTSITLNQPYYNMLGRGAETNVFPQAEEYGVGTIVFCPLAQGLLTSKYLSGSNAIPADSRAADPDGFLSEDAVTESVLGQIRTLSAIAESRGQTMAQMALSWTLKDPRVTSALIGASRPEQVSDCVGALDNLDFSKEELAQIESICPL
jgi:L-glyceraldehyde 3-phosphate reductase